MLKLLQKILSYSKRPDLIGSCVSGKVGSSISSDIKAECEAHKNRGNQLLYENNLEQAAECYKEALELDPTYVDAYVNLGYVLRELRRFQDSEKYLVEATRLAPQNADVFYMLGTICRACDKPQDAVKYYMKALERQADFQVVYPELCQVLFECGRFEEAKNMVLQALNFYPESAEMHNNLGVVMLTLDQPEEALENFSRAIELKPDYADAYSNRGAALSKLDRLDDALVEYERALKLKPYFAEAHNNWGNTLLSLNRPAEALKEIEKALEIKPGDSDALKNCGIALARLNRQLEALKFFDQALAIAPDDVDALHNRGIVLFMLNRYAEALAYYEKAAEIQPQFADAHFNASLCRLVTGDFERGWEQFEWRWNTKQLNKEYISRPLWLGRESLRGKTILLHAEQGLGDTLQFSRYVRLVAEQGAKVVLEVQLPLKTLLADLDGVDMIIAQGEPRPHFDCHCPLMSLPLAFQTKLDSIIADIPYVFSDPERNRVWENKLGKKKKPRIGLVWSGNTDHKNDRNRSITLSTLASVVSEHAQFVCLQKDMRDVDKALIRQYPDVLYFGDELNDFSDTAALVESMDVVISVDTSVAHLAGALGKPVWILLPYCPDWRWLLERTDSPWYPSARLFRQSRIGEWDSVISDVTRELECFIEAQSSKLTA